MWPLRGVRCSSDRSSLIGRQQALDLLARVLLDPATRCGWKIPGTLELLKPSERGRECDSHSVDGNGIDVARAIKSSPAPVGVVNR